MKKHLEVSAAMIVKEGKVFAAQRGNKGELALKWEFPGGKLEIGETAEQALIREIKEELDTQISVTKHVKDVNHEYNTFTITLHGFICKIIQGDLKISEHIDSRWLSYEELETVDWAEADWAFIRILQDKWKELIG